MHATGCFATSLGGRPEVCYTLTCKNTSAHTFLILPLASSLLVHALRHGHWIVLDELNLAPTDVLEALNWLLDDNRELIIPETQEVIRLHPHFSQRSTRILLAYMQGARFCPVPSDIVSSRFTSRMCLKRSLKPFSASVAVSRLPMARKSSACSVNYSNVVGSATFRDLFRWAGRDAGGYQELAENGYMLLAEYIMRCYRLLLSAYVFHSRIRFTTSPDLSRGKVLGSNEVEVEGRNQ
ncbi:uncharacterized protein F5147DRAFT_437106 [Suillus discolor]|uniref:ATPase dynein-related AAA domain-containing protein n=1 Tax=Suillus discolor TaxID=1912936 RepID=A0A9P7JN62_9AGAM|nr:uncharacterized protein F5147DRAFT_437106 [Suillus discolor]KAG2091837.1 hypothetical protein F5147DRAFT_437106 [Suillus discolor]